MPIVGGTVGVFVLDTAFMFVGLVVQVEGAGGMEVTAVGSSTTCTLENLGWSINAAPAAVISSNAVVAPSGPSGETGAAGAPTDASYWCRVTEAGLSAETNMSALATGYVKVTTGTGVPSSTATVPIADINTGASAATTVLAPNGAGGTVAVQVNDARVGYAVVAMGANDVDWSAGRCFTKTLPAGAGTTTITFSNIVAGKPIMVILTQDGTTARDVDWADVDLWPGGTEIEMTSTLGAKAIFSFVYDGVHVMGTVVNDYQ